MSRIFRPVTVEKSEIESVGGLIPLNDDEISGLSVLLSIPKDRITRLPLYRTFDENGLPGPSFKFIVEELMKRMPSAHVEDVISPYFMGEKIDNSIAKGKIDITNSSSKTETITIYYKYHSTW